MPSENAKNTDDVLLLYQKCPPMSSRKGSKKGVPMNDTPEFANCMIVFYRSRITSSRYATSAETYQTTLSPMVGYFPYSFFSGLLSPITLSSHSFDSPVGYSVPALFGGVKKINAALVLRKQSIFTPAGSSVFCRKEFCREIVFSCLQSKSRREVFPAVVGFKVKTCSTFFDLPDPRSSVGCTRPRRFLVCSP